MQIIKIYDIMLYGKVKGAKDMELVGTIIIMIGIIFIYDARQITKKRFSFSDQNGAAFAFKIIGFIISAIGGSLILI